MASASGKPTLPDAAPESLGCLIELAGRKGRATPCRVSVRRFAGRGSPGEERGQRRVRARHQDRDPRRGGQVADHHRGHALAARIEEQHVLGAQAGQRAGQLAVAVAGGRAFGRSDRAARRPRSGPTARWTSARGVAGAGRRWRTASGTTARVRSLIAASFLRCWERHRTAPRSGSCGAAQPAGSRLPAPAAGGRDGACADTSGSGSACVPLPEGCGSALAGQPPAAC